MEKWGGLAGRQTHLLLNKNRLDRDVVACQHDQGPLARRREGMEAGNSLLYLIQFWLFVEVWDGNAPILDINVKVCNRPK